MTGTTRGKKDWRAWHEMAKVLFSLKKNGIINTEG